MWSMASGRTGMLDAAPRTIGFVLWFGFILFCIGLNQSNGLSCADDAYFAIIAKSLASGLGYATTFATSGEISHPVLFNPSTGTGPTLIVPCAVAFKIFGKNEVLPGLTAILTWGSILTLVLVRISRRIDGFSFLFGISMMCAAFVATFSFHFEQWYAFLGEIVAAAFLILAHWIISNERFSKKSSLLCSLAVGCAFQAKFIAIIAAIGIPLVFVVRGMRASLRPLQWVQHVAALLIGFLIPTLTFEAYKLFELGGHGYLANWHQLLHATKSMGMQSSNYVNSLLLKQRIALVHDRFGVNLTEFLILIALGILLYCRSASKNWILLSAGLLLSVATAAIYWVTLSIGWARYLVIAVAIAAFFLSIPIFTLELWRKLFFAVLTLLFLRTGFSRAGYSVHLADHGLFRPTTEDAARASLVRIIGQRKQETTIVISASQSWPSYAAVEFLLPGSINFKTVKAPSELREPEIILLNHRFDPPHDELINKIRARTSSTIFAAGPYELLEVR